MPYSQAYGGTENGCNGWYENGIYKAVIKEMAMANSSYARAAGIQSEISKVTVTRVASSEVECKRQTNVYRKDMIISVNNISREQRVLRKCMVKYSKKKHQHKVEKEKREKEDKEKEQRQREELEKWHQIHSMLSVNEVDNNETSGISFDEQDKEHKGTISSDRDENNNEAIKLKRTRKTKCEEKNENSCSSLNPFDILPAIVEVENEQENQTRIGDETAMEEADVVPSRCESPLPFEKDLKNDTSNKEPDREVFTLTLKPLKPRKHIISFSDLIKLKHSHDTNKLFAMVHMLAQKHGVNQFERENKAGRRNSRIPRKSTVNVISESLRKTASVLYPMKFGYGDHETNRKEKFDFYSENLTNPIPPCSTEHKVFDFGEKLKVPVKIQSQKEIKRNKTSLVLGDETRRKKQDDLLRSRMGSEGRSFTNITLRSSSSKLPAINSTRNSPNNSRCNSVSWTEAFGLLKSVHNIEL